MFGKRHPVKYQAGAGHSVPPASSQLALYSKSTSLRGACGLFSLFQIHSVTLSLVVFVIPLLSHLGILMISNPTAARASTTPRLGGPQGLNS